MILRRKYGNRRVERDGYVFDSAKEAEQYGLLRLREKAGEIARLRVHPHYSLVVDGLKIGIYTPDFDYLQLTPDGRHLACVVEDVKPFDAKTGKFRLTEGYRLRKKLMKALYGIDVREV